MVATGKLTTFPGRSRYQIVVDHLEPAGAGALMALLEERRKKLAGRGPVRRGAQEADPLSAARHRRGHLADRRGDPRHPASAARPLSEPRARLAGAGAGRGRGRGGRGGGARLQRHRAGRAGAAAGPPDRRARRRLDRGPLGLQRGGRGARRRGEPHPGHLRGRPRDRLDADRPCRRPARADADRRGGDGGAGPRRACSPRRASSRAATSWRTAASWRRAGATIVALCRALPSLDDLLALPRQKLDDVGGTARPLARAREVAKKRAGYRGAVGSRPRRRVAARRARSAQRRERLVARSADRLRARQRRRRCARCGATSARVGAPARHRHASARIVARQRERFEQVGAAAPLLFLRGGARPRLRARASARAARPVRSPEQVGTGDPLAIRRREGRDRRASVRRAGRRRESRRVAMPPPQRATADQGTLF